VGDELDRAYHLTVRQDRQTWYKVDVGIGPAGDVWITNNWQDWKAFFPGCPEALSTLCAGQGVAVFYGMAKPVRTPLIGPASPS
jgi:hypothetical protein